MRRKCVGKVRREEEGNNKRGKKGNKQNERKIIKLLKQGRWKERKKQQLDSR